MSVVFFLQIWISDIIRVIGCSIDVAGVSLKIKSRFIFNALATVLLGSTVLGGLPASATERIVPPTEWTWIPAWSPDGNYVAVCWPAPRRVQPGDKLSEGGQVFVPTPPTPTRGYAFPVAIESNFDARQLLVLKSGTFEALPFSVKGDTPTIAWSFDGKWILLDRMMGGGQIIDAKTGKLVRKLEPPKQTFAKYFWSPKSTLFAVSGRKGAAVFEASTGKEIFNAPVNSIYGDCLAWSPDGKSIAVFGMPLGDKADKGVLNVFDSATGKLINGIDASSMVRDAAWSADGKFIAYSDTSLHVVDGTTKVEICKLCPEGRENSIEFKWANTGSRLAYIGSDFQIHILDVGTMKEQSVIPAEKSGAYYFYWSPNDKDLAISDHTIVAVCDTQTGQYLGSKKFLEAPVIQWTPDGKALAICVFTSKSVSLESLHFEDAKSIFEDGESGNPWASQKVVRNLDDCMDALAELIGEEATQKLKNTKKEDLCIYTGGPFLGMQLRNLWGLRTKNELVQYFNKNGVYDGAAMSSIIIESLWRRLNGEKVTITDAVKDHQGSRFVPNFEKTPKP